MVDGRAECAYSDNPDQQYLLRVEGWEAIKHGERINTTTERDYIMNNPYFEVGEEVILVSENEPQFNGDYIVAGVFDQEERAEHIRKRGFISNKTGGEFGYDLGFVINVDKQGFEEIFWAQSALRKKHKPSTDSFTEMMSNIDELVTG